MDYLIRTEVTMAVAGSRRPQCTTQTKNEYQCTNFAAPESDPPTCRWHLSAAPKKVGNPNKKCKGFNKGKPCSQFSIKGKDFCRWHIPDPEERRMAGLEQKAKLLTHNVRMQDFMTGKLTAADLDDEELLRGRIRNNAGTFQGKDPIAIPKAMHDRMIQELYKRADQLMRESLIDVVKTFTEIATNPEYEPKDRIKAGQFVYERLRGKLPDTISFDPDKPFHAVLEGIISGPRTRKPKALEEPYMDADFVEEEED